MNNSLLPQQRDKAQYTQAVQEFSETAMSYQDVLAVYTAGTVRNPGISDLDFIVCLKDKLSEQFEIEDKLSPLVLDLIGSGTILKINDRNFSRLNCIDLFPLRHVAGMRYSFEQFNGPFFTLCRVLDWLPERLYTLTQFKKGDEKNIVRGLQLLKSVGVCLGLLDQLMGTEQHVSFSNSVQNLRDTWFKSAAGVEECMVLVDVAERSMLQGLVDLDVWLVRHEMLRVPSGDWYTDLGFSIPNGPTFYFGTVPGLKEGGVIIPPYLAHFLLAQGRLADGFISSKILNSFTVDFSHTEFEMHPELTATIKLRMEYVNSMADFFLKNNLKRGLLKYGWYLAYD